jgi:hypothetical protein
MHKHIWKPGDDFGEYVCLCGNVLSKYEVAHRLNILEQLEPEREEIEFINALRGSSPLSSMMEELLWREAEASVALNHDPMCETQSYEVGNEEDN